MNPYTLPLPTYKTRGIKITLKKDGFVREVNIPPLSSIYGLFIKILPDIVINNSVRCIKLQSSYNAKVFFKVMDSIEWIEDTRFTAGNQATDLGEFIIPINNANNISFHIQVIDGERQSFVQAVTVKDNQVIPYDFDVTME